MDYPSFIEAAYWTTAVVLVALVALAAVLAALEVHLSVVRRRDRRMRRFLVECGRDARAFEDACWALLRQSEYELAIGISIACQPERVAALLRAPSRLRLAESAGLRLVHA